MYMQMSSKVTFILYKVCVPVFFYDRSWKLGMRFPVTYLVIKPFCGKRLAIPGLRDFPLVSDTPKKGFTKVVHYTCMHLVLG